MLATFTKIAKQEMSGDWFYQIMGETFGPVNEEDLRKLAREGDILPETFIRAGGGEWVTADHIGGLFARPLIPIRQFSSPFDELGTKPQRYSRAPSCPHCGAPLSPSKGAI